MEDSHQTTLKGKASDFQTTVEGIKTDFATQLQTLKTNRYNALVAAYEVHQTDVANTQTAHDTSVGLLNMEAQTVINDIIESHKKDEELTNTIPALNKDWFEIMWDSQNRRMKRDHNSGKDTIYDFDFRYVD